MGNMEGKFVIGEKCKINQDPDVVKKCFERAKLTYSNDKHGAYVGMKGELIAMFANDLAIIKMEDGTELKIALDCVTREGVSNLIRKGSGDNWDKKQIKKQETEMKK